VDEKLNIAQLLNLLKFCHNYIHKKYTFLILVIQKVQKTTSEKDCANRSAKGRYYTKNIFPNFNFVKSNFCKYPYVTFPTKTSIYKV